MSNVAVQPWIEAVALHPDVTSENFSKDILAVDLGRLADGNPNVPAGSPPAREQSPVRPAPIPPSVALGR